MRLVGFLTLGGRTGGTSIPLGKGKYHNYKCIAKSMMLEGENLDLRVGNHRASNPTSGEVHVCLYI